MRWVSFTWIALLAWPLLGHGQAVTPTERRAQIAAQRELVDVRHRQALQACEREFTQTACVEQARRDRRRDIDRLDAELATLDLAERRRRAAERQQRLEEKRQAAARRAAQPSSRAASAAKPPPAVPTPDPVLRARKPADPAAAAEAASARQAARSRRLAEQKAHAEAVQQRNAERARKRPPAAPLPSAPASALR